MPPKNLDVDMAIYVNGTRVEDTGKAKDLSLVREIFPLPVRPIGDLHSVPHFRCGFCNRAIVLFKNDKHPDVCRWCGLPIAWSGLEGRAS